ncbi:putative glucanase GlgE [Mycobacteroides abscessus subsp. abscessus]|nr:putative glucanase GlgE [Mycobacteroides abscessus subsp. abscessus]
MDVVTGRIGIDDVAPVIAGGRYPAKAVVGEVVPVAATVWREGHDAVAATLVVRCLGPSYPQLAEGPLRRISAPRDRDKNAARVKPVHAAGRGARPVSRELRAGPRGTVDLPGRRVG